MWQDGKSALTCATLWGRLGVMKQLIDAGAHTEAFDAVQPSLRFRAVREVCVRE